MTIEETYEKGVSFAKKGDYVEAAKLFKKAADEGHTKAQYNLGICLHEGLGGYQAHMEAFFYFKKAADSGHMQAHYMLGYYYVSGIAPYDDREAGIEHFRIAAESGHADAQYNYGVCLLEERQEEEAAQYFQMATDQGIPEAAYNLGVCYANGRGVQKDEDKAVEILAIAAGKGHLDAAHAMTKILKDRHTLSSR